MPNDDLTFTLPRKQWSIIVFLAIRGVRREVEDYIQKGIHTSECINDFVSAAKTLSDLYKATVPDAEKVIAEDTLPKRP
jgi:hypothetical protein